MKSCRPRTLVHIFVPNNWVTKTRETRIISVQTRKTEPEYLIKKDKYKSTIDAHTNKPKAEAVRCVSVCVGVRSSGTQVLRNWGTSSSSASASAPLESSHPSWSPLLSSSLSHLGINIYVDESTCGWASLMKRAKWKWKDIIMLMCEYNEYEFPQAPQGQLGDHHHCTLFSEKRPGNSCILFAFSVTVECLLLSPFLARFALCKMALVFGRGRRFIGGQHD